MNTQVPKRETRLSIQAEMRINRRGVTMEMLSKMKTRTRTKTRMVKMRSTGAKIETKYSIKGSEGS